MKNINPFNAGIKFIRAMLPAESFLLGIFNFIAYSKGGKKKGYLIDFSSKFNEIKFCTLLMNWLIWEKMFTYFYTKFRPVNRMHYMKCGVNSSLHNSGCCRGLWHLGSLFYHDTNSQIHKERDILQIYFCVIFHETRHHAQAHVTSGTLVHLVKQQSINLKLSKSRTGSDMRYSCHHNSSHFSFPIFAHSWRFSALHSLQSITLHIYYLKTIIHLLNLKLKH